MTEVTRPHAASRRLRALLLAALTALAALLFGAGTASAAAPSAAETRVGAIGPGVTHVVGIAEHIAAGQHQGRAPSQLQIVSGHCVAAEAEGAGLSEAFHYTRAQNVASIEANGLRVGGYATPTFELSPLQAQIDLALPPNRGLPEV